MSSEETFSHGLSAFIVHDFIGPMRHSDGHQPKYWSVLLGVKPGMDGSGRHGFGLYAK